MLKCYYVGWIHDYNRKKPIGMMNALKKQGYHILLTHVNNAIYDSGPCDLLFGELKTIDLNFKNFKTVFVWSLMDLNKLIKVAQSNPHTKIIILLLVVYQRMNLSEEKKYMMFVILEH